MSKEALLPPFHYESKRKSGVVTVRKLLAVLLLITAANVFTFTHPQTSAHYISKVHHQVARWSSYPAIVDQIMDNGGSASEINSRSEQGQVSYEWTPSGRTRPLSPEPGMDLVSPESEEPRPRRRITGGPGSDIWTQEDVDEDLQTIFSTEDFITRDQVR